MSDRIACLVPFCRRSIAVRLLRAGHDEWICGPHWQATSRSWRRRRSLFRRRGRIELEQKMWNRLKTQAIEIAGGIT